MFQVIYNKNLSVGSGHIPYIEYLSAMLIGLWEKELSISCKMAQPDGSTVIDEIKAWVA